MKIRKSAIPGILLLVLALLLFSCNRKVNQKTSHSGIEYYRNLLFSETPYDIERGTHPVTPEEAKTINSYKFTYDNAGRLLSVEYMRNGHLLGYSSMGEAARITYKYNGNQQIKHFFNKNNQPTESAGVFALMYMLDDDGNRVGLMCLGKDGSMVENRNKIHSWKWSILDNGMVKENRYNLKNEETVMNQYCPFYELRFTYDKNGYVRRMANYMADTLYNCTAENCGDIGVSYFAFSPDNYGDVDTFAVYNVIGQMSNLYWGWSKRISKFDRNGYVLETIYIDQDNEYLSGNNVPVIQYEYDEHGAPIVVKNLDRDRNLMNNPGNGVAITEYRYNDLGERIETLRYDMDHNPVNM